MKRQMSNWMLFLCFSAVTGAGIAAAVWLYLSSDSDWYSEIVSDECMY